MAPCLPMLLLILKSNSYILMDIFVFKFGIVTNGLSIIRHIFYNKDFMMSHSDILVEKKSDSPDEDKCVHDTKLLIPTLKDTHLHQPLCNQKII